MKKLLLLAVVIGLVLGMSGIAKAESWMLWEGFSCEKINNFNSERWNLIEAFPTYQQCTEELKSRMIFAPNCKLVEKNMIYCSVDDKKNQFGNFFLEYKCLPDTVDPRK